MHLSSLVTSALTLLSTATATPLSARQYYGPSSTKSWPGPFNILIRPVDIGIKDVYLEPIYLSQVSGNSKAVAMHGVTTPTSNFTLKKGVLSTIWSPKAGQETTWSNVTPNEGQFLTFTPSKGGDSSADAAKGRTPVIRISKPGGALVLMSVDDDVYAFYFCSSKDGKTQYGVSIGKRPGKDVKCVNVYMEVAPVDVS